MTHNYTYNFGFLAEWLENNPRITRRQVLEALQITDYNTLRNWTTGKTAMPLAQLLRFCNYFSVPLGNFFFDHDAVAVVSPSAPDANSMTEPAGGYKEKSCGNNTPVNPLVHHDILPDTSDVNATHTSTQLHREQQQISEDAMQIIMQMQQAGIDERQILLRTIETQNEIIKSLTSQRNDEHRHHGGNYAFAAEG